MNNSAAKGMERRRSKQHDDGAYSHNHPWMSYYSRVLLKQSRLFHLVLLPWDIGLWYVGNSFNKELLIYSDECMKIWAPLCGYFEHYSLNSVPFQIHN
jgi:hypothetical protein